MASRESIVIGTPRALPENRGYSRILPLSLETEPIWEKLSSWTMRANICETKAPGVFRAGCTAGYLGRVQLRDSLIPTLTRSPSRVATLWVASTMLLRALVEGGDDMRAVTVSHFGEEPSLADMPTPVASPGQVLIKLAAASVNPMDAKLASGEWRPAPVRFPMILGVDGAGTVEAVGDGTTRFAPGDKLFGQLFIPPIGAYGTYAEYVAITADAPLASVPDGVDFVVAASAPTAGGTGLSIVELVEPLDEQVVLIIGAGGGVGTFATQFALRAGATVIAEVHATAEARMRSYGVATTIVSSEASVKDSVRRNHPDGVDVLIDLAGDARMFASTCTLVRPGGTAITTQYVADLEALQAVGVRGVNFALRQSTDLLERVGRALAERAIAEPPIRRITLEEVPDNFRGRPHSHADGKTVIVL